MTTAREIRFYWLEADPKERERIANRLRATGRWYSIHFFARPPEARVYQGAPPDRIVLHVGARQPAVQEVLDAIRGNPKLAGVRVVFLAADSYDAAVDDIIDSVGR